MPNVRPDGFSEKMGIARKLTIYVENGIKILEIVQNAIWATISIKANARKIV